ncbi:Stigma-specific protein [Parasponia andersonii]|uniref:Stigma-specific protein n=1 Tax=Parasponia andersonii TaxID=3476 RepID=A0A2P5BTK0_PARAD|nr:Stigma-specific protein [Parasponia andersonii]
MKALRIIFLALAMLMALAIADLSATPYEEEPIFLHEEDKNVPHNAESEQKLTDSLRGTSRFLASRRPVTCDKNPKVCRSKGSSGSDCCKKKCVDLSADRVNCGRCGKKCRFSETCCKGKCVNTRSDKKNCGSCNKRCHKGSSCVYGMCSYA